MTHNIQFAFPERKQPASTTVRLGLKQLVEIDTICSQGDAGALEKVISIADSVFPNGIDNFAKSSTTLNPHAILCEMYIECIDASMRTPMNHAITPITADVAEYLQTRLSCIDKLDAGAQKITTILYNKLVEVLGNPKNVPPSFGKLLANGERDENGGQYAVTLAKMSRAIQLTLLEIPSLVQKPDNWSRISYKFAAVINKIQIPEDQIKGLIEKKFQRICSAASMISTNNHTLTYRQDPKKGGLENRLAKNTADNHLASFETTITLFVVAARKRQSLSTSDPIYNAASLLYTRDGFLEYSPEKSYDPKVKELAYLTKDHSAFSIRTAMTYLVYKKANLSEIQEWFQHKMRTYFCPPSVSVLDPRLDGRHWGIVTETYK